MTVLDYLEKKGKAEIQKFEYLEDKKCFLPEIKSINQTKISIDLYLQNYNHEKCISHEYTNSIYL